MANRAVLRAGFLMMGFWVAALPAATQARSSQPDHSTGVWVSCVSEKDVLGSTVQIQELVSFARKAGLTTLFVQVYRADKAWFNSDTADASPYRKNRASAGKDTFQVLLDEAHAQGLEVHAWINTLTLSLNEQAPLLQRLGPDILTQDQRGRTAFRGREQDPLDRYYGRENQLFLEPGDDRVLDHLVKVVRELAGRYPSLDGIHFDYIRYPAEPPYIPGSRFNPVGLSYGYGPRNVERFRQATGLDPHKVDWKVDESLAWDNWKRDQVTGLIRNLAAEARKAHPGIQISCAAMAAFDRAYSAACQDWGRWAREGIVDFVVLMSYSPDSRFVEQTARAAAGLTGSSDKVSIGLGAYLMEKNPARLKEQIQLGRSLKVRGLVLFDYTAIASDPLRSLFAEQEHSS